MQNDYISRETAIKALCTVSAPTPTESWIVEKCIERVNEQPAADVRPVVHAHWTTDHPDKRNKEWHCSNCKFEPQVFENSNFCPYCGGVMDGGNNNA